MRVTKRLMTATLAVALIAVLPGTALASDEARGDAPVVDRVSDKPSDRPSDKPTDRPSDKPTDRPSDKPSDRPADRPTDRPSDKPIDRCVQRLVDKRCVDDKPKDRPVDRCLTVAEHDRRCIDDHHPHDFNVRKLIWRLIKAHEWEKLIRLLHWLGWL